MEADHYLFAQRIIDLHAGKISVESEPGVGTEFKIALPLVSSLE